MHPKMWKPKFFNKQKLLLAFEYGVVLGDVAKQKGVEVTPEMVKRAEHLIEQEFTNNTAERLALDMIPNLLAIFETSLDVPTEESDKI